MLVLSRKQGQSIMIGDDIRVHILELNHGQVKVGIEAPTEVLVLRNELKKEPSTYVKELMGEGK